MSLIVRYQVFVSSTYEDLRSERQQATQAILEAGYFPSGMELFPASDDTQWELIKRVIEESDYYVVIVGGKYGSIGPDGLSFTEMEYDFAVEHKLPVLGFVRGDIDGIPSKFVENDPEKRRKLENFRAKVMSRTCRKFNDPLELGMAVMKSLMHEARVRPRIGWVRADQARTEEDRARERNLEERLDEATKLIKKLERKLRDGRILVSELSTDQLSQGSDNFNFVVFYRDESKNYVTETVPVSWDDVFRTIGPSMYGYIMRKNSSTGRYPFEESLENYLRSKVVERSGSRKLEIQPGQVDACVFQFKELGYIEYDEQEREDGKPFRGIVLTSAGEKHLARLITQKR